ncbi:hypothetical protein CDL12_07571 [Handroanthus impetiginosus]|uniref:Uncharacterized protein n=1 Tax=Handroanthus impetiginosus TaxID=429701 RepID=A0A2G9HQG2_9LAMI|nr:hypothetical protein CDL12_07571 [Handroanthus impetiginosus]
MGFVTSFGWLQSQGKKQCRSLLWRIRSAMKRTVKNGSKQKFKFQYDPHSYALNFDDGCLQEMAERGSELQQVKSEDTSEIIIWIYVLWVE